MARPHIEFIHMRDVVSESVQSGPLVGSQIRRVSEDSETGAFTAFCSFPPDWTGDLGAFDRPIEIFVVAGALEIDGQRLGTGC